MPKPRHASPQRHSLLRRVALSFAAAVILTALALALSAYFITEAAQEEDALDKALDQSAFNLVLADTMLPATPAGADYERLVNAFQIRGDFATLIETGGRALRSGLDVSTDLITPELAAKVAEGRIGYQIDRHSGRAHPGRRRPGALRRVDTLLLLPPGRPAGSNLPNSATSSSSAGSCWP